MNKNDLPFFNERSISDEILDEMQNSTIGDLNLLETDDKSSLVNAINELKKGGGFTTEGIGSSIEVDLDGNYTLVV